jgi:hypothetical protein
MAILQATLDPVLLALCQRIISSFLACDEAGQAEIARYAEEVAALEPANDETATTMPQPQAETSDPSK